MRGGHSSGCRQRAYLFIGKCVEPVPEAFRGGEVCTLYLEGQAAPGREDVQAGQDRTVCSTELHEKGRVNRQGFSR